MRFRNLLTHTCTMIITGVETGTNRYNQPIYGTQEIENYPCRADDMERVTGRAATGTDYLYTTGLFLPPDRDITEDTLFRDITDEYGRVIFAGTFEIDTISPIYKRRRLHHYEATLQKREG